MKAHFVTGYGQRELPIDCIVSADLEVAQLVKLTGEGTDASPYTIAAAASKEEATHMIAQSDFTMGHYMNETAINGVPGRMLDYIYSNKVAKSTTVKKVALFDVSDKLDIVVEE